jgi:alanyl-tRNA synthetase
VKQAGSEVSPEHLRFDFSHYGPVSAEELRQVEDLANESILADEPVRVYETTRDHAEELGAIAFFGDKYGDIVRVVEAGRRSIELCGGTHVGALGMVGPVTVVSEGSIGANMRRVFAVTGTATVERLREGSRLLERSAALLRTEPSAVPDALQRLLEQRKAQEEELRSLRAAVARAAAAELLASAVDGTVVARRDGLAVDGLRDLAVAARDRGGLRAVVLIGSPDGQRVALAAALAKDAGVAAGPLVGEAARAVGGGGGGKDPTLAVAGGRDPGGIETALATVRARLGLPPG